MKVKPKPNRGKSHLSYPEIALALKLRDEGLTQVEIGQRLNRDKSSICELLAQFVDTRPLATKFLQSRALRFAQKVSNDANVEESLEMLDRLEVVPKRQQVDTSSRLNIFIGMPEQPLDLSPTAFAIDAPKQGAGSD